MRGTRAGSALAGGLVVLVLLAIGCSSTPSKPRAAAKTTTTTAALRTRLDECTDRMAAAGQHVSDFVRSTPSALLVDNPETAAAKVHADAEAARAVVVEARDACSESLPECPSVVDPMAIWMLAGVDYAEDAANTLTGAPATAAPPANDTPDPVCA